MVNLRIHACSCAAEDNVADALKAMCSITELLNADGKATADAGEALQPRIQLGVNVQTHAQSA